MPVTTLSAGQAALGQAVPGRAAWGERWAPGLLAVTALAAEAGRPALSTLMAVAAFGLLTLAGGLRFPKRCLTLVTPLLLLMGIGLLGAWDHAPRDVARDLWQIGRAALAVALGVLVATRARRLGPVLTALAAVSIPVAAWHLFQFVLQPSLFSLPVGHIRGEAGSGSILSPIVLGALFAFRRHVGRLPEGPDWIWRAALWLNAGSLVLSFSRTNVVCLLLLVVAAWPRRRDTQMQRKGVNWKALLLVGVGVLALSQALDPAYAREFGAKIGRSAVELVAANPGAMEQINDNWRGYELFRALRQYGQYSSTELLLGTGAGTLVDLGFAMPLGGEGAKMRRFIPILHNAYGMVLVKMGAVGLMLYVALFGAAIAAGRRARFRSAAGEARVAGALLVGAALCVLATSATVSGLLNSVGDLDALGLLMGAAWATALLPATGALPGAAR